MTNLVVIAKKEEILRNFTFLLEKKIDKLFSSLKNNENKNSKENLHESFNYPGSIFLRSSTRVTVTL